jgi:hypothetical protein
MTSYQAKVHVIKVVDNNTPALSARTRLYIDLQQHAAYVISLPSTYGLSDHTQRRPDSSSSVQLTGEFHPSFRVTPTHLPVAAK